MSSGVKLHPSVRTIIEPIIDEMTRIYNRNKTFPAYGPHNETDQEKLIKRKCVHMIKNESGDITIPIKRHDGDFICEACGRKVNTLFDQHAVDTLMKAIEVLDGLVVFAPQQGLMAPPLQTLISCKEVLPGIAQIQQQFNEFVKRDEQTAEANRSIVSDYHTPERYFSITGFN